MSTETKKKRKRASSKSNKKTSSKKKAPAKKTAEKKEIPSADDPSVLKEAQEYSKSVDGANVVKVTEVSGSGSPARVVIECADPQVNGAGDSVCDGTREIAIQDLFQVKRCTTCQKRAVQLYRNRLARERRAELAKLRDKEAPKKSKAKKSKKAKSKKS